MDIFFLLFTNLIPLYLLIFLGWISGRYLDINLHSVARINIFILLPIVTFGAMLRMKFDPAYIMLPFILMAISYVLTFCSYQISKRIWDDGRANLVGTGTVNGNAIYFGLPVILYLFGPEWTGAYILMNMGPSINNSTLAYFLAARSKFDVGKSIQRVMKFPTFHAMWVGLVLNLLGFHPDFEIFNTYHGYALGAMVFLGMMMIGIALSKIESYEFDAGFIVALFAAKFLLWPLAVTALIFLDIHVLHLFDVQIYKMMLIWSVMPLMGNLVAYAAEYNTHPQKAATAVLASSIFALFTIPLMLALFGLF